MVTHCIIMSSSYSEGKRIAIDYCLKPSDTKEILEKRIDTITSRCGSDVSISSHYIQTESENWRSVIKKDAFFANVKLIKSIEEFIELIQTDRKLKGIDVAKYILSQVKCTHLKLEKLVYLCYADYLCKSGKKLFQDEIYAFNLGPVIESVYKRYKGYARTLTSEIKKRDINSGKVDEMPPKSRVLFAEDGIEKINSINETIERYGKYSASDLVDITHKSNTPWDKTYDGTKYMPISDETILQYHKYETV